MGENNTYLELELAAWLDDEGIIMTIPVADLRPGDAYDAIQANLFAELNIPYHTDDAIYCYTFHLFNKLNNELALVEAAQLQSIIERIHADYSHLAREIEYE